MKSASPHEAVIRNWPINKDRYIEYAQWFIQDAGADLWFYIDSALKDSLKKIGYDKAKRLTMTLAERYEIGAALVTLAAERASKTPFDRWLETQAPVSTLAVVNRLREAFEAGSKQRG